MDVCLDRKQFGAEVSLPTFGGTSGAETKKALQDIQVCSFLFPAPQYKSAVYVC